MTDDNKNLDDDMLPPGEAALLGMMAVNEDGTPMLKDYIATAGKPLEQGKPLSSRENIIDALKTVSDPEIMINIWDLGLVYRIEQKENGDVFIDMTVTAPTCPVAGVLPQQAADAVSLLDGVKSLKLLIKLQTAVNGNLCGPLPT